MVVVAMSSCTACANILHDQFGIEHSTVQIEQNADACSLALTGTPED
jgi:hypothetical protein